MADEKEKDQLVSKCIDQKLETSSSKSNLTMNLTREAGKPMRVLVSKNSPNRKLTADNLSQA